MDVRKVINERTTIILISTIWLALWVNFIVRDLFVKGYASDYIKLTKKSVEERYAYTYGKQLYDFLKSAKDSMRRDATYALKGIKRFSLDHRRCVYYLYPLLEKKDPEYILDIDAFVLKKVR